LAAIGATASYIEAERKGYSTFELALQVSALPRSGNPVLVETGIVHLGNSSIRFMHRMRDPIDGSEFARLGQFGVQLDLDTGPAALLEAPGGRHAPSSGRQPSSGNPPPPGFAPRRPGAAAASGAGAIRRGDLPRWSLAARRPLRRRTRL
jgi:hypothetical protein